MGALTDDPESVQVLAQTILDRKIQIENLETQIAPKEQTTKDYYENQISDNTQQYQETSLMQYHRNPIINWLQKMVIKMEQFSERLEQKRAMKENRIPTEPKVAETKWEEYQNTANSRFSRQNQATQEKTAHQLFVEKISGNGAYHTFGKNAQNMEQSKTMANPEKIQHMANQMQQEGNLR